VQFFGQSRSGTRYHGMTCEHRGVSDVIFILR